MSDASKRCRSALLTALQKFLYSYMPDHFRMAQFYRSGLQLLVDLLRGDLELRGRLESELLDTDEVRQLDRRIECALRRGPFCTFVKPPENMPPSHNRWLVEPADEDEKEPKLSTPNEQIIEKERKPECCEAAHSSSRNRETTSRKSTLNEQLERYQKTTSVPHPIRV